MPIYFIRHGQSEFNARFNSIMGDPMIYDAPLSPLGHQQAIQVQEHISSLGIERVIASPLTRAIQTAEHIFKTGPAIEIDPRHRELLSHSCDVGRSPEILKEDFPGFEFSHLKNVWWHDGVTNDYGIAHEPAEVYEERVAEFRGWLAALPGQSIAIVGHGNFFKSLMGRMLENCEIHEFTEIEPIIISESH